MSNKEVIEGVLVDHRIIAGRYEGYTYQLTVEDVGGCKHRHFLNSIIRSFLGKHVSITVEELN